VTFTPPKIDETTTVIDGGRIITGSINANRIATGTLKASMITAGTMSADRISGGTLDFSTITAKNLTVQQTITANDITTGTLEVGKLTFKNNGRSVRSGRVNYIKDLEFSWQRNNSLTIYYDTVSIDGWKTVVEDRQTINGRERRTQVVMLGIGFNCKIYYDTLEFNNGLCVDYSDHTYTTEAPYTEYV
jgi:hypothetical protein